jgi:hypothetical protein
MYSLATVVWSSLSTGERPTTSNIDKKGTTILSKPTLPVPFAQLSVMPQGCRNRTLTIGGHHCTKSQLTVSAKYFTEKTRGNGESALVVSRAESEVRAPQSYCATFEYKIRRGADTPDIAAQAWFNDITSGDRSVQLGVYTA